MKVRTELAHRHPADSSQQPRCVLSIRAETDPDDRTEAVSANIGGANVRLTANVCRFVLPVNITMPHPDLIALAALKLFSPYIGSRLHLDHPVSSHFAEAAVRAYPHLREITSSTRQERRRMAGARPAISFSGGADSVAVAAITPPGTPLIQLARMPHPELPDFEDWYRTESNIRTLEALPIEHSKYTVFSDMEFMSTNGRWCVYPDTYVFTVPVMLLADELRLSHVLTGDIWSAFTAHETLFTADLTYARDFLFAAAGLDIEYPCNGIGEVGSYLVAEEAFGNKNVTTCQYGQFQQPCMRCIKCFRKSLYGDALSGSATVRRHLDRLNGGPSVKAFAASTGQRAFSFAPSYKYCAERISYLAELRGPARDILDRAMSSDLDVSFVDRVYEGAYASGWSAFRRLDVRGLRRTLDAMRSKRPGFVHQAKMRLLGILDPMTPSQEREFRRLDWAANRAATTTTDHKAGT